ncbi:hypothetical protein DFH07DRAFT_952185 [Mycena maculata]|uniref:Uncharacterized protein n=1 Tax=Mycena maculata TaxID=230809 RepID=A0AAD7JY94_9AGAR|nr:hypothetical protein DFH07DRAFT_952185 [Mycena maculata]
MPPSRSPTPPLSPLHDILNLTQQLTPSKSPRTVNKIRQQLQVNANDAQQQAVNLKRRAVDAEQQVDATRKPRKKRRRGDRARGADDSEVNPEATEARVREAGRYFAIQNALFLIDDDVLNTKQDPDFDLDHEYDSPKTERQGQLRDILEVLPDDVKPKISQTWVQDSVLLRWLIRPAHLHPLSPPRATSASRFENFSSLIGHKPATDKSQAFYDRWAVPVLYDKWDGHVDLNGLFRGELPVKIYVSIIRGPHGAEGIFEGMSKVPQAKCLQRIHKIDRVSAGGIAISCILAIWLLSADTMLVQVGDETTIDYGHRHRIYLRRIREGLRDKKAWAVGLFEYWDRILFPNADRDHDYAAACDELEDDEELENIFSEAPSITIPEVTNSPHPGDDDDDQQRRSDNNDRSDRATSSPTPHSRPRRLSTRQPAPPHVTSSSPSRAPSQLPASPPASAAKRRPTGRFSHRRAAASGSSRR